MMKRFLVTYVIVAKGVKYCYDVAQIFVGIVGLGLCLEDWTKIS